MKSTINNNNKIGEFLRRACVVAFLTLLPWAPATAQNGINFPFSQFGIGFSSMPYNLPAASSMGGVVYTSGANNRVNPFNPASYALVEKESFVFDMGLSVEMSTLKNRTNSQFDADGSVGYLSMAFPLSKWWKTALGILPLTDVSYQSVQTIAGEPWGEMKTLYEGNGGVTQFFWGNGFNILGGGDPHKPALRAGFNVNYLNGLITRAVTYDFQASDTTYFMDSRRQKETFVNNVTFDAGLQYDQPLGELYQLSLALTVKPGRTMRVKDNALVYTFVTSAGLEYLRDTIFPASGEESEYESTLEQPFTTGVGLAIQRHDHWRLALDATYAPWASMKYTENTSRNIFGESPLRYGDNLRVALGAQLLGDKNSASYLRRVTFSMGGHYESGKLRLEHDGAEMVLDEWGFGMGATLPMRKGRSAFNVSLAYSSFGTADLLRRNVFTVGISIGSCESWFVKRKYN